MIKIGSFVAILFMFLGMICVFSIPAWLLWWWIAHSILGLPYLNLLETAGLIVLCNILFKSNLTVKQNKEIS